MAYCSSTDITVLIPSHVLLQALDDDADGVADTGVLDSIIEAASNKVDALLQQTSGALDTPYGQIAVRAAICFACFMVYQRKGNMADGERNPYESERKDYERLLTKIADGAGSTTEPASGSGLSGNVTGGGITDNDLNFWDPTGI